MTQKFYLFIHQLTFGFYLFLILVYNFIYIVIFIGFSNKQEVIYLAKNLNVFIHCFIAVFLIVRFNPFYEKKQVLNENDSSIIFGSGIFLLVNLGIFQLLEVYLNNRVFGGALLLPPPLKE